jgi:hypothetical protein
MIESRIAKVMGRFVNLKEFKRLYDQKVLIPVPANKPNSD